MTPDEAKAILSGPLIFGDARQIEALRFLNGPKESTAEHGPKDSPANRICQKCDGEGTFEEECDECDGRGVIDVECEMCDGTGVLES
jgi:RecJ-like exonuclease